MNIIHYTDWRGNFGDDLNPIFFGHTVPEYAKKLTDKKLYGIGTLLNAATNRIENAVILGSGYGYGDKIDWDPATVEVLGVRGPLTAKAIGMDSVKGIVIGDPALYVPKVSELLKGVDIASAKIVVAPHHRTSEAWDLDVLNSNEFFFLDPGTASVADYIATIRGADLVIAESLHGAIMAASFGVPFIPIAICSKIDSTKWTDFFMLLQEEPPPHHSVPLSDRTLRRRLTVAYARNIKDRIRRSHYFRGQKLNSAIANDFIANLRSVCKSRDSITAKSGIITDCQGRIEAACLRLVNILERSV